jgi:hypothetical protein
MKALYITLATISISLISCETIAIIWGVCSQICDQVSASPVYNQSRHAKIDPIGHVRTGKQYAIINQKDAGVIILLYQRKFGIEKKAAGPVQTPKFQDLY